MTVQSSSSPRSGYIYTVELSAGQSVTDAVRTISDSSAGIEAYPNYLYYPSTLPNDPKLAIPSGTPSPATYQYASHLINLPSAWAFSTGNSSVVVAVIDSGADVTHEDLVSNLWVNPGETSGNHIDDDHNGFVDDVHGWSFYDNNANLKDFFHTSEGTGDHGTHVSGIISGVGNNAKGIAGNAFGCRLMILKAIDSSTGSFTDSTLIQAIHYAMSKGAKVINMSLGGGGYNSATNAIIQDAQNAGILVVVAAGNDAESLDIHPIYPAGYSGVIAVSACNTDGSFDSRYSNYGSVISVMAPGTAVLSTTPTSTYGVKTGTSMATPMVSGVLALMRSYAPSYTASQIKTAFFNSLVDIAPSGRDATTGYGRLDAYRALRYLDVVPPTIVYAQTITSTNATTPYVVTATITDDFPSAPSASVYYREYAESTPLTAWIRKAMTNSGSTYQTSFLPSSIQTTRIKYYMVAQDLPNFRTEPSGGSSSPYVVRYPDIAPPIFTTGMKDGDYFSENTASTWTLADNSVLLASSIVLSVTQFGQTMVYPNNGSGFVFSDPKLTVRWDQLALSPAAPTTFSWSVHDVSGNVGTTAISLQRGTSLDVFGPQGAGSPILSKPNPFNPRLGLATICYQTTIDCDTDIQLYSLNLTRVRSMSRHDGGGYHEWAWDGRDDYGAMVPGGMYVGIIKVVGNGSTVVKKVKIAVLK